jgi:hypothetical protein
MSYVGKWRIVETTAWDTEYLDESEDACVEFARDTGMDDEELTELLVEEGIEIGCSLAMSPLM